MKMSTGGGPVFTFSLPGWKVALCPPVSQATDTNVCLVIVSNQRRSLRCVETNILRIL